MTNNYRPLTVLWIVDANDKLSRRWLERTGQDWVLSMYEIGVVLSRLALWGDLAGDLLLISNAFLFGICLCRRERESGAQSAYVN